MLNNVELETTKKFASNVPQAWESIEAINYLRLFHYEHYFITKSNWNTDVEMNADPQASWKKIIPLKIWIDCLKSLKWKWFHEHKSVRVVKIIAIFQVTRWFSYEIERFSSI